MREAERAAHPRHEGVQVGVAVAREGLRLQGARPVGPVQERPHDRPDGRDVAVAEGVLLPGVDLLLAVGAQKLVDGGGVAPGALGERNGVVEGRDGEKRVGAEGHVSTGEDGEDVEGVAGLRRIATMLGNGAGFIGAPVSGWPKRSRPRRKRSSTPGFW